MNKEYIQKLNKNTNNGKARDGALQAMLDIWINPTSLVSYNSNGVVLVIAEDITKVKKVNSELFKNNLEVRYLITKKQDDKNCFNGAVKSIDGFLGSFNVEILDYADNQVKSIFVDGKKQLFDIIIDLSTITIINDRTAPFGYYATIVDKLEKNLLDEINSLKGILEKPRFFNLNNNVCVHSRNKTQVCNRCINVCPAKAITSDGDSVSVNSNLCHGFGSCAAVCPTGAMSYNYPNSSDNAKKLHSLLTNYQQLNGENPIIVFYAIESFASKVEPKLTTIDENILFMEVEELGFLSIESFLYIVCLGIKDIVILINDEIQQVIDELKRQIKLNTIILENLGYKSFNIQLIKNISDIKESKFTPLNQTIDLLNVENKRNRIFETIDFLYTNEQTKRKTEICEFDKDIDSPFGEVIVDSKLCTLCMACSSVCPTKALSSGAEDKPILNFQEDLCVQCALCVTSCPEKAVSLNPRLVLAKEQRESIRILHQDEPFHCVKCDKVFASKQVINKMLIQLKDHSMFQGDKLKHLTMCEDCRVKEMF